jgi:anti-sigma factor RsiW
MECARAWDLLSAYLDGDLPEREREGIAAHLRHCARCAEEERALKETLSLLKHLPPGAAPPGLLAGIRLRLEKEQAAPPLWKKLFLPAHIKIPLEAAAVVLVFLLAYGIRKEMPASKVSPAPSAFVESGAPESGTDTRTDRQKAGAPVKRPPDAADRETAEKEAPRGISSTMPGKKERADVFAPRPGKPAGQAKAELPSVPATRVSTGGGAIGPASLRDSPAGESTAPRVFAPPLSRLLRPMPSGREVTIEVSSDDRTGLEDRIAILALRLGGTVRREETGAAGGVGAEETFPLREIVRVHIPVDTADAFLEELGKLGTIPPEGMTGKVEFPAGPSPDTVAYTVRIRVRHAPGSPSSPASR